jgi:hypothetical protein
MMGWTSTGPRRSLPSGAASLYCFSFRDCPHWQGPLGLASALLDITGRLPSQVTSPRPQDNVTVREGFYEARPLSGTNPPLWHPQVITPIPTPKPVFFIPVALPSRPFTICFLCWSLASTDCSSRGFDPRDTSPLPRPPVWTHLCFHHPSYNISARMTEGHC